MTHTYMVGIPKETKDGENRVALTPSDVQRILQQVPHSVVFVEKNAGAGAGFSNYEYLQAGASICETKQQVYKSARFIVKVKEPNIHDLPFLREDHILFCYFHLASDPHLTKQLLEKKITAIAFESMIEHFRFGKTTLPLLEPMSKIAGRLSIHMAHDILRNQLNQLITEDTNIHIIGAGNVGLTAAKTASGLGAYVHLYDVSQEKLNDIQLMNLPRITTMPNLKDNPDCLTSWLEDETSDISIVVCGALVRDDKAPHIITQETLQRMSGSQFRPTVFVDVSIDQGGCIEGISQTSLSVPYYKHKQHYLIAVPNMPGSVSHTASIELSKCVWPYVALLTSTINTDTLHLREDLIEMFETLNSGMILKDGRIVNDTLKQLFGSKGELIV